MSFVDDSLDFLLKSIIMRVCGAVPVLESE